MKRRIFLCFTLIFYKVGVIESKSESIEFVGCFRESKETKLFNFSPGDYLPSELTPFSCIEVCGKHAHFAGLEDGQICLCAKEKPQRFVSDNECSVPCKELLSSNLSLNFSCGGRNRISVYDVRKYIHGLQLRIPDVSKLYSPVELVASIVNGQDVSYKFFSPDDSTLYAEDLKVPKLTHYFTHTGLFEVVVEARNSFSFVKTAKAFISVTDAYSEGNMSCHHAQTFGLDVECTGYVLRGSPFVSFFDFGDGHTEYIESSVTFSHIGSLTNSQNVKSSSMKIESSDILNRKHFTVLMSNTEFFEDSRISAFEFEALETGLIYLQIFRPKCLSPNSIYCSKEHRCQSSNIPCEKYNERSCRQNEVFCFLKGRCVSNGNSRCDEKEQSIVKASTNFELIGQQQYNVNVTGRVIVELENFILAKEGDVVGYTSYTGKINYENHAETKTHYEYIFPPSFSLNNVLLSAEATTIYLQHSYKVHYINPFQFYLRHNYSAPKSYEIKSNISAPSTVFVEIPVKEMKVSCPTDVPTNHEFALVLNVDNGTNLTYKIDFGNGTHYVGVDFLFICSFIKPGYYRIKASVYNLVSLKSNSFLIKVYDKISGLAFEKVIEPVAVGQETAIHWCAKKGTNITYNIDFGDGSSKEILDFSSKNCHSVQHIFKNNGSFSVKISAKNEIDNASIIQEKALVEVPIKNFTLIAHHNYITNNIYLNLAEPLCIEVLLSEGSNVICRFDFNDSIDPIEIPDKISKYLYTKEGEYAVSVECFNSISRVRNNLNMTIIVEKLNTLSGLQIHVKNTVLGEFSYISASLATGSLYTCKWDLGKSIEKKVDKSTFGTIISLKYDHAGNYTVKLDCWNSNGLVTATKMFFVDIPIINLKFVCPPKYINISESVLFQIHIGNGSQILHEVSFGDGNKQSISSLHNKLDVYHLFRKSGVYEVKLKTWNSLDSFEISCPYSLHVQCPVASILISSNSPIGLDPGQAVFKAEGSGDCFPTNASVEWNFGDGSFIQTDQLASYGVIKVYTYSSPAKYAVILTIQNEVSKLVFNLVMEVQKIQPVVLNVYWKDTNGFVSGIENKYFPLKKRLHINITAQAKDQTYTFRLNDSHDFQAILSFENSIEHIYIEPGVYLISGIVQNTLGTFKDQKRIIVQESILDMKVNVTLSVSLGDPIFISTHALQYGSQVCGVIDFGDNVAYILNMLYCNKRNNNQVKDVLYSVNEGSAWNLSYIYHTKGSHNVSVHIYNKVSSYSNNFQVDIKYRPCSDPQVLILSGGDRSHPAPSVCSSKLILQSNVSLLCPAAENVIFFWSVYDEVNNTLISENISAKMPFYRIPSNNDPTIFKIPERSLPYGLIRVDLFVVYKSIRENLSYINARDSKYFDIQYSQLLVKIEGGIRRAVGFMTDLEFDASKSFDPDHLLLDGKEEMNFTWYCRRKDEEFPSDYEHPSSLSTLNVTSGCFQNGRYRLNTDFGGFRPLNEEVSKVSIFTALVQNASYVMRVVAKKDRRKSFYDQEFILYLNQPPSLLIYCSYNCYEKTIPSEPLRVQSVCKNCRKSVNVLYYWRLYKIQEKINARGKLVTEEVEITDLESKTTTPIKNPNIALKPNVMELGMKYVLRVAAKRLSSADELSGFSDFVFTVNQPPYGGFCHVSPNKGITLNTMFQIKCDQWNDEDTPLLYVVDSVCGGMVQNMYTGPENQISIILPLGNKEEDYWYDLIVRVEDKFKFGVSQKFKVQVKEPLSVDYHAVGKNLLSLANKDEMQALTRMAVAVASVLNKKSSNEGSSENRELILQSLSDVKPCKLSEIKQVGGVHMELTQVKQELTDNAKKKSAEVLSAMSDCMSFSDARDPYMPDTVRTLFLASSNILSAGMIKNASHKNNNDKVTADIIASTVDNIGSAFMRQMVAGDMPEVITVDGMNIQMAQIPENADEDDAGFKLPDLVSVLKNQSESLFKSGRVVSVGAMVTSFSENPYKSAEGSDDIASDVMRLAISGPNGKPLDLAGEELSIFVKRNLVSDLPPTLYEYDKEGGLIFHRFNYTWEGNDVVIESRPVDLHTQINYFIAFNKTPTFSNALLNHSTINLEKAKLMKSLPDPFIRVFTASELNGTGEYYIGIKLTPSRTFIYANYEYNPSMHYILRIWETVCKIWDEELATFVTKGCKVGQKTTFNKTHCICKMDFNNQSDSEIHLDSAFPTNISNAFKETIGSTTESTVLSKKLSVKSKRDTSSIKNPAEKNKREIKRATFASSFFVAPNPIDFSKAFAGFAKLSENPTAFSVVLSIFGIYLILLFWARREDRKDIESAGVTALKENDPSDCQFYEITVFTGFSGKGRTTANVFMQLSGDEGEGEVRQLTTPNKRLFKKRGQDVFLASFPDHIGDLQYLRIWHDNAGKNPSWYLSQVMIHDLNADRKYLFINDNMIAVEAGNGSLERVLPVAGPEDMITFNHLFFSTSQKNISDNHIWFSVFIRPPKSRFTRVQRLSCCLTLLYCTMLTNAMFYQVGGESTESLHIGPLSFNPRQIGIAVITSLIIFPVNILIVGVFRNVGPKPSPEEMALKKKKRFWWLYEIFFCCKQSKQNNLISLISAVSGSWSGSRVHIMNEAAINDFDIGLKLETLTQEKSRLEKEKKKKKKRKLPWWMKYFAWLLLVLVSFTSAFFVVLYGFTFGKEKSAQWLSALFLTLFQDICVSQPIKIFGLALFIALIVKKPQDDEEEDYNGNKKQIDEEYINTNRDPNGNENQVKVKRGDIIRFKPPSKERIAALRAYRLKEIKMYNLMRDFVIYIMFVIALCQVTYSFMDSRSYLVRESLNNIFVKESPSGPGFYNIKSSHDVWLWLNYTVVNGLFSTHWYNGIPNVPGFTQDLSSNLFGGARLRQLRVEKDSCIVHPDFQTIITKCNSWYTIFNEDRKNYTPGWKLAFNNTPKMEYPESWEFQPSKVLQTFPFIGYLATYTGGGYVADLGKHPLKSQKIINHLHQNKWIDGRTRALFLEFSIYNAQVNLFAIANLLLEFSPTNAVEFFTSIHIARLYTFAGETATITLVCQFFVVFFFLIAIYKEGKKIYKLKKAYFKGFWNLYEFSVIILLISTIAVFFTRIMLVKKAVKSIHENQGKFVSFNKIVQWDLFFSGLTSILVFLSCIKSIRILQYNKTISLFVSTLKGSARPLAAFLLVFLIFFTSFTAWAYLMFIPYLPEYKNYISASESVMSLLLGSFKFNDIASAKPVLGSLWFTLIMIFGVMYIMNVFLTIVMETYASVKEDLSKENEKYQFIDFMVSKFLKFIGRGPGTVEELLLANMKTEILSELEISNAQQKGNGNKTNVFVPNKYHQILDHEIENKLSALEKSLDKYWYKRCPFERLEETIGERVLNAQEWDYGETKEDITMQKDLEAELIKWS